MWLERGAGKRKNAAVSGEIAYIPCCFGEKQTTERRRKMYYAPLVKWEFGGPDLLDGISVYDAEDYWYFVTYGLSELYEKESEDMV